MIEKKQLEDALANAGMQAAEYVKNERGAIIEILQPGFLVREDGPAYAIYYLCDKQDRLYEGLREASAAHKEYAKALRAIGLTVQAWADDITVHKNQTF